MLALLTLLFYYFFFFNDTATTEIYTLSLHDALPISRRTSARENVPRRPGSSPFARRPRRPGRARRCRRSEEHTSELQSHSDLVCRLLLEKKKTKCYELILDSHMTLLKSHQVHQPRHT